jgi:hypothetical protein
MADQRRHQGIVLGKSPHYFQEDHNVFFGLLQGVKDNVPVENHDRAQTPFEIVAVTSKDHELAEPGLLNRGSMPRESWYSEVAHSKVMVG